MYRKQALVPFSVLSAVLAATAFADIRDVPSQYLTIQDAIDASVDGDEVWIAPGTYHERIDFLGKAIVVRGLRGAERTVILGAGGSALQSSTVQFVSGEGDDSVLQDVTLAGPDVPWGIYVEDASPKLRGVIIRDFNVGSAMFNSASPTGPGSAPTLLECQFLNNVSGEDFLDGGLPPDLTPASVGGAMLNYRSRPHLWNCRFESNFAGGGGAIFSAGDSVLTAVRCDFQFCQASIGGAILASSSITDLNSCRFLNNSAGPFQIEPTYLGGAILLAEQSPLIAANCIFAHNEAGNGGAIYSVNSLCGPCSNIEIDNCTFVDNQANTKLPGSSGAIFAGGGAAQMSADNSIFYFNSPTSLPGTMLFHSCNVQDLGPGGGNIDQLPLFVDRPALDYRLQPVSPSVDAGSTALVPQSLAVDINFLPRIVGAEVDHGAHECLVDPCTGVCVSYNKDCNGNGVADTCDIALGTSVDCNDNLVPDDCEGSLRNDIVFIVDGTFGISGTDFLAQLEAIDALVCGGLPGFEFNGFTFITVLQVGTEGHVEIPRTEVTAENLPYLCTQILTIAQETNSSARYAGALESALEIFRSYPQADARRIVLMTNGLLAIEEPTAYLEVATTLRSEESVQIDVARKGAFCGSIYETFLLSLVNAASSGTFDPDQTTGGYLCTQDVNEVLPWIQERVDRDFDGDGDGILNECETCVADITGDGVVDVNDLLAVLAAWGPCTPGEPCPADVTFDGQVDVSDLLLVVGSYGDC